MSARSIDQNRPLKVFWSRAFNGLPSFAIGTIANYCLPLVGKGGGGAAVDSVGGRVSTTGAGGGVTTDVAGGSSTIGVGWGATGCASTTGDVFVIAGDRSGVEMLLDGLLTGAIALGAGCGCKASLC